MMRLRQAALVLLLVGVALSAAGISQFAETGTATDTATTVTIVDKSGATLHPLSLVVRNRDSTNTIWLGLDGVTATAADPSIPIPPGDSASVACSRDNCPSVITLICAAGKTADYHVVALR